MKTWMPIETAPKHQYVMLWDKHHGVYMGIYEGWAPSWIMASYVGRYARDGYGAKMDGQCPSHWMPLPDSPTKEGLI